MTSSSSDIKQQIARYEHILFECVTEIANAYGIFAPDAVAQFRDFATRVFDGGRYPLMNCTDHIIAAFRDIERQLVDGIARYDANDNDSDTVLRVRMPIIDADQDVDDKLTSHVIQVKVGKHTAINR